MDEDGEPLMDPDLPSDREPSPEPGYPVDDFEEEDWRRERSPTPVLDSAVDEDKVGKSRKRLVKKGAKETSEDHSGSPLAAIAGEGLDDWEEEEEEEEAASSKERKASYMLKMGKEGSGKKEKRKSTSSKMERSVGKVSKAGSKGYGGSRDQGGDPEIKELWDTIAGGDSEV